MNPRRLLALAVAVLACAALPPPATAAAVSNADPFYLGLLRDGNLAYDRGDYPLAAKELRIACFGLLDEPLALADCLVRLAVAQGAASQIEEFRDTFRRLVEVEERFGAYGKLTLPPELRANFEQRLIANIPTATLESLPAWKPLAGRKAELQIAGLPPKERRKELEARLAKEPKSVTWNLLMAELDLAEDRIPQAMARAEQTAASAGNEPRALCLRGLTRAWGRKCGEAVVDLATCAQSLHEAPYATALLGCWAELGQWRQAAEFADRLPASLKDEPKIAALRKQVSQHVATLPVADTTVDKPADKPADKTADPAPAAASKPAPKPAEDKPADKTADRPAIKAPTAAPADKPRPLSLGESEALERARRTLATGNSPTKDLKEALRLSRLVADAHPEFRDAQWVAGEAAYRNSRWSDAVAAFRRGGEPGEDRPELLFYYAVSLFEAGDPAAAAVALKRSLPRLQKSPYIEAYEKRILGSDAPQ